MKKALILQGGWEGHEPADTALKYKNSLERQNIACTIADDLGILDDLAGLEVFDLIIPCWTMGKLTNEQEKNLCSTVAKGTGLAGHHGGMGDAFRGSIEYEWMVGGHFSDHPHVGYYAVRNVQEDYPLTRNIPKRFAYDSEQYYLQIDPAINVLLETDYDLGGQTVNMPVAWTKKWGQGRVFYCALGHKLSEFEEHPYVWDFIIGGAIWAAK